MTIALTEQQRRKLASTLATIHAEVPDDAEEYTALFIGVFLDSWHRGAGFDASLKAGLTAMDTEDNNNG